MVGDKVWDLVFTNGGIVETVRTEKLGRSYEAVKYHIFATKDDALSYVEANFPTRKYILQHRTWHPAFLRGSGVTDHRVKA